MATIITFELMDSTEIKKTIALTGSTMRGFASEIGISHSFLSQILNGKKHPSPVIAKKIAEGIGKEIEDIFLLKVGQ